MPMHHLRHNRAHTLSAACTFIEITKIKKLIYYTYRYVLLSFKMSRNIDVSNLGPGIFTYKLTYFVFAYFEEQGLHSRLVRGLGA